ncbi:DoxX family protein [Chryseobacterium limigenitum]|uniref:Putative oxidoreductase n=1 Tax=Chryseobacterium limigenitum TaxID=1612149 RepID=A0A1K2IF11_9FLAO|nr:DoxX family protein [Chryseobacterium limigenitum]SFZ90299.1 putative oxidoreductase [Chryseobacterium limigenitum]
MKNLKLNTNEDIGILILRIALGGLMLFHGIAKITQSTDFIRASLMEKGLPLWLENGVYIGELLIPLTILFGVCVRISGLIFSINMLFSIWLVYSGQIFTIAPYGGWTIELNVLFFLGGLALFFMGSGKYAVYKRNDIFD